MTFAVVIRRNRSTSRGSLDGGRMFSRYDNGTRFSSGATVRGRVVGGNGVVAWATGAWAVAKGGGEDPESDEPAEEVCVNGEGSL